jgi:hypothetical protein
MELNINSLSDFVVNATILWALGLDAVPQYARNSGLFKEVPIPQQTGNTRKFTEIDLEEYAGVKREDDQSSRARVQQGYSVVGTLYRVSKDIGISYEMRTQGKYMEIKDRLTNLGRLVPNRLDLDLSHRIGFGTVTSYVNYDGDTIDLTVGDTYQLFYTAHTLKGSSTTFRNRLANNPLFSRGALESMELMRVQNTYNQFGEKMAIPADVIFSTDDPNTINSISTVLRSTTNTDQTNPSIVSTYVGKYRHVILPRIATTALGANDTTKAKYWGLASTTMSTAYLGVHEEAHLKTPPADGRNNEEFPTDAWNFGTRGGWMIVILSGGWCSLSTGDGVA